MTTTNQSCLTCRFASYEKTATGRLKRGTAVRCRSRLPSMETMAEALKPVVADSYLLMGVCPLCLPMWPDSRDFGATCSQWKEIR